MATTIQVRRGTTAQIDAVTPASGEPIWETDGLKLAIGDGSTAGGKHIMMGDTADYVAKALFDAQTILAAVSDNTPVAVTIAEQRIVGRITAGNVAALTAAQVLTLINVEDGADVTDAINVDAAGAVMEGDYGAYSLLAADTIDAPFSLAIAASRFVGRKAAGGIAAMTGAEALAILSGQAGAAFDWNAQNLTNVGTVDGIDVSAHDPATTGVHGLGSEYFAEFEQEGQVVSKVVWKDISETGISDSNRTTSLGWTDLDLTAETSANAKFAILLLQLKLDSYSSGRVLVAVRKNGTTPPAYPGYELPSYPVGAYLNMTVIVGLDAGQIVEYKIDLTGTAQVDTLISVLGYIE